MNISWVPTVCLVLCYVLYVTNSIFWLSSHNFVCHLLNIAKKTDLQDKLMINIIYIYWRIYNMPNIVLILHMIKMYVLLQLFKVGL